jgi:hypothetical protein
MTATVQEIEQALAALGTDEWAVAATLVREGCKGKREDGEDCPVFHYLDRLFPGDLIGEVDGETVWLSAEHGYDAVTIPGPVANFIGDFDRGEHEELVAES